MRSAMLCSVAISALLRLILRPKPRGGSLLTGKILYEEHILLHGMHWNTSGILTAYIPLYSQNPKTYRALSSPRVLYGAANEDAILEKTNEDYSSPSRSHPHGRRRLPAFIFKMAAPSAGPLACGSRGI